MITPSSRAQGAPLFLCVICAISFCLPARAATTAPGGFLETVDNTIQRIQLTASQIQQLLPARGKFTFPSPYDTTGIRITNSSDCGGADCVDYVGYSYWRNMNNSTGSDTMLIFLGLDRSAGGQGPTLFQYNKVTDQVTSLGPLFDSTDPLSWATGEGWYFSATQPTKLYVIESAGSRLLRYDVMSRNMQVVFDIGARFGTDKYIWQASSSADDTVHTFTLRQKNTWEMLGCGVYRENTADFLYYPKSGDFDECQVDRSGRWLVVKENVDGLNGEDNVIVDLQSGTQRVLLDEDGAGGHSDLGFGYMVAADNWDSHPNAWKVWNLDSNPLSGTLVYYNNTWGTFFPSHVSHTNALSGVAPGQQYACGSSANRSILPEANDVICFRLDGSSNVLVVAPVMTDLDASGGNNDYAKEPKGNLDPTGQYFIWTSNMGGSRQDAFLVKVPAQLLMGGSGGGSDSRPPSVSITAPAAGTTVSATVAVAASASDDTGVAGVQFLLDGANLGAELTTSPYSVSWNAATAAPGSHVLSARARDASGNTATSAGVSVTVAGDTTPPVISGIAAQLVTQVGATIVWTTDENSDSQVEFGISTAYGSASALGTSLLTAHTVLLTGLSPGTTYHYRVKSRDSAGNLTVSGDRTFITSSVLDTTAPDISGISATAVQATQATITWITNESSDSQVDYGTHRRYTQSSSLQKSMVTTHSVTLTGLIASTNYHYRVRSRDAAGNLAISGDLTFRTTASDPPTPELAAWWKLDESSGVVAADSSGNGEAATLINGPLWGSGMVGGALNFDGVDDYAEAPAKTLLDSYPLSVAFWVKTSTTTGLSGLVNKYVASSMNGYQVFLGDGQLCAWYFRDASNYVWDGTGCTLATAGVADNRWHHVVFVVDYQGGRLYVDGAQTASRAWTGAPGPTTTPQPLDLGRYPGTATPYFSGSLDQVRVYTRALSAGDVLALYQAEAPAGAQSVSWTDQVNVTVSGATISKNSGCDGCPDAGAVSQQQIGSGDGYLEFTAGPGGGLVWAGLAHNHSGTDSAEIDFGIRMQGSYAEVRENGVYRKDTPFAPGDLFRVAIEGGKVNYYRNGTLIFTSAASPAYALRAVADFNSLGASISGTVLSGAQ